MRSSSIKITAIGEVCEQLEKTYGNPRLNNPYDPVDDLVFIILSNKTSPETANKLFGLLKARFVNWDDLLLCAEDDLAELIKPGGFATIRSRFILGALAKIRSDFGSVDLSSLVSQTQSRAFDYLIALPGVSNKVAKCVMLYTLGFKVLPVDAHVYRVAKRLGWTKKNRADLSHSELEELVAPQLRYSFHVNSIAHGRARCRPKNPLCYGCPVNRFCKYEFKTTSASNSQDLAE